MPIFEYIRDEKLTKDGLIILAKIRIAGCSNKPCEQCSHSYHNKPGFYPECAGFPKISNRSDIDKIITLGHRI